MVCPAAGHDLPKLTLGRIQRAEFNGSEPIEKSCWRGHRLKGVIADPFMGGGTPIYEANRRGFHVVGTDINPMAYWVVRQASARDARREAPARAVGLRPRGDRAGSSGARTPPLFLQNCF